MAVLVSSDLERPAILGRGRQEQLRLDAPPAVAAPVPAAVPVRRRPDPAPPPGRPAGPAHQQVKRPGGELTLDEMLVVAWEGVTAHNEVSCPVCRGAMVPRPAAGPESLGGRCGDCGSIVA
jgi:hypothetical protein